MFATRTLWRGLLSLLAVLTLAVGCVRSFPTSTLMPSTSATPSAPSATPSSPTATIAVVPSATTAPSATPLAPTQTAPVVASATPVPPTATIPPTIAPTSTPLPPTTTATPLPVPSPYDVLTDPVSLMASYVNAINRKDYARAWNYWETKPSPSFSDFQAGFADTESVLLALVPPTFIGGAAGSFYATIPAMLVATHTDGTLHSFVGCYTTRAANPANFPPPTPQIKWDLYDATVAEAPGDSTDALLLASACPAQTTPGYEDRSTSISLLASYYDAINRKDYTRAWNYWENKPNPSFAQFEAGYADTASVLLVVMPPGTTEGAAGSIFANIPTLLLSTHTDNTIHSYAGCYTMRAVNPALQPTPEPVPTYSLWSATIASTAGNSTSVTLLRPCGP